MKDSFRFENMGGNATVKIFSDEDKKSCCIMIFGD